MKKILYFSLLLAMMSTVAFGQKKRVAVVTFYVDKYIGADKIAAEARQSTYEKTKEDDPRFDLRPILEEFHETFMKKYVKEFPFEVVIASGRVWATISYEMARDSWGEPEQIQKSNLSNGSTQKWT